MLGAESAGAFTGPGIDYYMSFRGSRRGQKAYRRIYAPFVTKDQWIPWFNDWSHCWSMNRLIAVCFLSPLLQAAFSTKAIDFACSTRPAASKENAISLNAQWSVNVTGRQWSTLCSCFQTVGSAQWYSTRKIQYISPGMTDLRLRFTTPKPIPGCEAGLAPIMTSVATRLYSCTNFPTICRLLARE